jgi:hypothetical protein
MGELFNTVYDSDGTGIEWILFYSDNMELAYYSLKLLVTLFSSCQNRLD